MTPQQARSKANRLLRGVTRYAQLALTDPWSRPALHVLRDRYLRSSAAKAAILARLIPEPGRRRASLLALSDRISVLSPQRTPIGWRFKTKGHSPTLRIVCNLPLGLRLAHEMARKLILAQFAPRPHIFAWPGRGRDRAIVAISEALITHGRHVLVVDVHRCFEHVCPDALYELDLLPPELIRNALDWRSLRFRRYGEIPLMANGSPYGDEEVERTGPRGLLEGSPASDALLAVLLDDLPDHLDKSVKVFVYGDNVVVVARDAGGISRAEANLVRYFAEHRAGPFILKTLHSGDCADGFEHLGYRLQLNRNGHVTIGHSDQHWGHALRRMEQGASDLAFGSVEALASECLRGFPASTSDYLDTLRQIAADELAAAHALSAAPPHVERLTSPA